MTDLREVFNATQFMLGTGPPAAGRTADPATTASDSRPVKKTESGGPAGYEAGKRISGRKRHIAVNVERSPIIIKVHAAGARDRDGSPAVIAGMLEKAPQVTKLWADGGCAGPKLLSKLEEPGLDGLLEIAEKPKDIKGFTVLHRRWTVERTFGWGKTESTVLARHRSLDNDWRLSGTPGVVG